MQLSNAVIEVTRRCNLRCAHCLRGNQQNKDMQEEHFINFLRNIDQINTITFTGGEPLMKPKVIQKCVQILQKESVSVGSFYIATNGHFFGKEVLFTLLELYSFCEDNETSMLQVSFDEYHPKPPREWERLKAFTFTNMRNDEQARIIPMGRSKHLGSRPKVTPLTLETDNEFVDGNVYLNCDGRVLTDCDLSYEVQRKARSYPADGFTWKALLKDAVQGKWSIEVPGE